MRKIVLVLFSALALSGYWWSFTRFQAIMRIAQRTGGGSDMFYSSFAEPTMISVPVVIFMFLLLIKATHGMAKRSLFLVTLLPGVYLFSMEFSRDLVYWLLGLFF